MSSGGHAGQWWKSMAGGQTICHVKAGKADHSDQAGAGETEIVDVLSTQLCDGRDNFLGFRTNK